jgi:serine/threonine-protein kinase
VDTVNQLGRYRLLAELGQGGMGRVYLGVARGPAGFSKLMVIKALRPELAEDPTFLQMFLDEARLAARLNHPNVVQTVEIDQAGNSYFLVMEYLDGQTLHRMRTRAAKDPASLPLPIHVRVLAETLRGLDYAHELKDVDGTPFHLVHRDVSPHNVFVTYDGQVKILDFGIAKAADSSLETRTGQLKGKLAYMPPEQAAMRRVDRTADIFAVGVMLWEATVGRRLWHGMNEPGIMHALLTGQIPVPRDANPSVDAELDRIVRRAMAVHPEHRYPTAADMADDLEHWLARAGVPTGPRDVGRVVLDAFSRERAEMQRVIEAQLRQLREAPETANVPLQDLSRVMSASGPMSMSAGALGSVPGASGPHPMSMSGAAMAGAPMHGASAPGAAPSGGYVQHPHTPTPHPSGRELALHQSTSGLSGVAQTMPAPPVRRAPIVPIVLGVTGALLMAGGALVVLKLTEGGGPPTVAVSTQPKEPQTVADPTPPPTAAPSAGTVAVEIRCDVPGARFFVDDAEMDKNPMRYRKDGAGHKLRVEAPGFEPWQLSVAFDEDVVRECALKPKRTAGNGAVRPPPPPPPTTVAPAVSAPTAGTGKPHRDIDTDLFKR